MPHAQRRRAESPRPANEERPPSGAAASRDGAGSRHAGFSGAYLRSVAAALTVIALAACGGPAGPAPGTPAPTPGSTPAAAIAASSPSPAPRLPPEFAAIGSPVSLPAGEIGPVVWARSIDPSTKAPVDRTSAFSADAKSIYAVVPVIRLAPDARLSASWTYNDTSLDAFTQRVAVGNQPGARWIEFHLTRADATPWPEGTYAIALRLGDGVVQTASVTVGAAS